MVEDDPGIRTLLTFAFQGEGFVVEHAANGVEALAKIRERWPQAIVLDLWMSVMNGPRFLGELRRAYGGRSVPVVIISADGRYETAEELGVERFLQKPIDMGALIETVTELVAASA